MNASGDVMRRFAANARIQAVRGQSAEARATIDEAMRLALETRDAQEISGTRQLKAEVLAMLGDHDPAVAELRTVHAMGYGFGHTLRLFLRWEPLRANPKFQQLMKEAEARADAQPRPKLR